MEDSALLSYIRDNILSDFIDQLVLDGIVSIAVANRLKGSVRQDKPRS